MFKFTVQKKSDDFINNVFASVQGPNLAFLLHVVHLISLKGNPKRNSL